MLVHSAQDTYDSLVYYDPGKLAIMGEIKGYDLEFTKYYDFIHHHKQEVNFFEQIVTVPDYNPVFSSNDTTIIFDYLNRRIVLLDEALNIRRTHSIHYRNNPEVLLDEKRMQFYVVGRNNGMQSYALLDSTDFQKVKHVNITDHAHPQNAIIYNGFLYYLGKEHINDNLNKLYRQRL